MVTGMGWMSWRHLVVKNVDILDLPVYSCFFFLNEKLSVAKYVNTLGEESAIFETMAKQFSPGGLLMYVFYVLLFLLIFLFSMLTTFYMRLITIFGT